MKQKPTCLFGLIAVIVLSAVAAMSQLTVDATVRVHDRLRKPTAGHAGSIGRKLPLQVTVEIHGVSPGADIPTEVVFVLTNSGKNHVTIPVSPNPGDLEPADSKVGYSVTVLSLYMTSDRKQEKKLLQGAELFGCRAWPDTLVSLAPGESVRVLALVALPSLSTADQATEMSFIAHAVLEYQAIHTTNGQTLEDAQEIGSSTSIEYSAQSLLEQPD